MAQQPFADYAVRSYDEVAGIMTARGVPMTRSAVWYIERRALQKLFTALLDESRLRPSEKAALRIRTRRPLRAKSRLPRLSK